MNVKVGDVVMLTQESLFTGRSKKGSISVVLEVHSGGIITYSKEFWVGSFFCKIDTKITNILFGAPNA